MPENISSAPPVATALPPLDPAKKLAIASALMRTALRVKAGGIRLRFPEWTSEQVEKEVKRRFFLLHD